MARFIFISILVALPTLALAQQAAQYQPLASIPWQGGTAGNSLGAYLNALFVLLITVSAIIAVVKITLAGFKYIVSGASHEGTGGAKRDIYNSLIGLAIILASVLILNTINPCITKFNLFSSGADPECFAASGN